MSFVPGRVGDAFEFTGLGDPGFKSDVAVAQSAGLEPANVTAIAWVRRLGSPGSNKYVLSKGANACVAASYALYLFFNGDVDEVMIFNRALSVAEIQGIFSSTP